MLYFTQIINLYILLIISVILKAGDVVSTYYTCHECDVTLQRQSWMRDKEWDEYIINFLKNHNCCEI